MNLKNQWKEKWLNQPGLMLITVVIWAIFIGLCIKAGTFLFTSIYSLYNPIVARDLYEGLNLYGLLNESYTHYLAVVSLMLCIEGLKAYLFFLVIRVFLKINLVHPFSSEVAKIITNISAVAFQIGITIIISGSYYKWLAKRAFDIPPVHQVYFVGGFEYLFMGAIIIAIAQVFKRGMEIQNENELTV
ncbi:DUF2975 domain-containing protein [Belliella sp. DSM 111904]|uniref:DUF2975 domain-containing protein n=1 Tax=Belliella filtrata TaxID=2923435 RepID=A0ABS9V5G8_9BACT|nr:DUF2975 domain-containing protein [Belliella filtrata]MCH7411218.1 DUF2975 domain-containing protein [Belliella filtrata]